MKYYVQFTAGTGSLVLEALDAQLAQVRVSYADDSAMILDSSSAPDVVAGVPYLKNAFTIIAETGRGNLDKGIVQLARTAEKPQFSQLPGPADRFRVMVHVDGSLTSVKPGTKSTLERSIGQRTGARVEARGMCREYWVVGRQEMQKLLLCARLPKPKKPEKIRGALSYELSAVLVAASRPTPRDVFLDPFGGTGSLPAARLRLPARQVWYSDLLLAEHRPHLDSSLSNGKRVRLLDEDACTLPSIEDGSVDVIVTDPPWGEHEDVGRPYDLFAAAMGESFARVLQPQRGRFVLLINRRNATVMRDALAAADLGTHDMHDVLVNGHPATVLLGGSTPEAADVRPAGTDERVGT